MPYSFLRLEWVFSWLGLSKCEDSQRLQDASPSSPALQGPGENGRPSVRGPGHGGVQIRRAIKEEET